MRNPRLAYTVTIAVVFVGVIAGVQPLTDYDVWWHIKTGQWIIANHGVPTVDVFSYSSLGKPWIAHEWASDVVLALIHDHLGLLGLIYFKAIVGAVTYALLAWLCVRRGASPVLTIFVTAGAIITIAPWINARPQMVLPLFIIIELHLLQSYMAGHRRAIWWLPALFVVWVNFHGGFIVGFVPPVLLGLCLLVDRGDLDLRAGLPKLQLRPALPLAAAVALAAAATLLNPRGLTGALYALQYLWGSTAWSQSIVAEFLSPDFHLEYTMRIQALMLLAVVALIASPKPPRVFDVLVLLLFTSMFLKWVRNGPLLVVVAVPIICYYLTERIKLHAPVILALNSTEDRVRPAIVWGAGLVLLLALVAVVPKSPSFEKCVITSSAPVQAAKVVQLNGISGNMYDTYRWGGYLIYALWPSHLVFMDGRADLHGEPLFREYELCSKFKVGWQGTLTKYDIQWAIVEASWPFCQGLALLPNWELIYSSGDSRLYIRTDGVNAKVYEAFKAGLLKTPD